MGTKCIVGDEDFALALRDWTGRIAEIVQTPAENGGRWALVGIKRRGAVLAERVWKELSSEKDPLLYGEVDISLYRDDYHLKRSTPKVLGTEIEFGVDGVSILLLDDVFFTGRTVRAAMDLILDYGRPHVIQLAVFLDRGHRELPLMANCIGRRVETERDDRILVRLEEIEGRDAVELIRGEE
jgi:pyrimidine operon attenuation protein/uracil phosphoribosyltransferase